MNIKTTKKRTVSFVSNEIMKSFTINKPYRRIWEVAKDFNADVPVRKGFGFLDSKPFKAETAVWCVNLDDDSVWEDSLQDNGNTLIVRNVKDKQASDIQNRIRKHPDIFDVNVRRLTFEKTGKNGHYTFLGVFVLSAIDFDRQLFIFKKKPGACVIITKKKSRKVKVTYTDEESTIIQIG